MIKIENTPGYNHMRKDILGGNVTGIWANNSFFIGANSFPVMNYHYLTAKYNNFEKNLFENDQKINYHLSGYGTLYNETLTSFLGESSERYSYTALYTNIKKFIVKSSYEQLKQRFPDDLVCDLEIINSYFSPQDKENYIDEKDEITWMPMNSLIETGKRTFIPLQLLVMFDQEIFKNEKRYITSSVSTGTASQETFEESVESAIIEYLQIDSFNIWWYSGFEGLKLDLDIKQKLRKWFNNQFLINEFIRNFQITFSDISLDKDIFVILCEVTAKKEGLPKYVIGVQGGYNLEKCIYRSFMECVTVLEYAFNIVWIDPSKFKNIGTDVQKLEIDNLDDNIIFYAKTGKPNRKTRKFPYNQTDREKINNLPMLIKSLKRFSKYAGVLCITPPEFKKMNLFISRVVIPELLPIALPFYPPYYHKRYRMLGGIINHLPHPLA
ncbi:streptolysin associated protein SagD [Heyndrickxia coagulans]|uniref:YcaO-like family protein n=1 Tax=Heyndrickxia coagulans TaxID=1398 RepID=UPI000D73FFF9|nr:YcaO-like family protein [Heyndrickxia coagulans]AWP35612.1 streptolysin associated protein SagD [Heyndrickxia coagulans]QDI61109.1 streptolysin associated protein SagD [Heyndrickxia coagulans]